VHIDWVTIGAQALNFLILMGLLKHFLYKPILDAIDTREKSIASQLADAKQQEAAAQKEKDAFGQKNAAFDADRAELLKKATVAANAQGKTLIDAARADADAETAKRHDALKIEEQQLVGSIRHRTSEGVFAVARKMMADLADASLEASIGKVFIRRLQSMDAAATAPMKAALASVHPAKAVVRSAFDMTARQQTAIHKAVADTFASDAAINFETVPALLGGIELVVGGQKLGWSIADYLPAMRAGVDAVDPDPAPIPAA